MRSTFRHIKFFYSKRIWNWISGKKDLKPSDAILIASDPRSGSTWLSEIINTLPESIIIDEPLHLNNVSDLKPLDFSWRQHIPQEEEWPSAKLFFEKLLKGQILNPHIVKDYKKASKANQLIIKTIRAKLLLPWLCKQFDFKYKPIVLIRNPFALIASLKRHDAFNYPFEAFTLPKSRHSEFLVPHISLFESLKTNEEQQLAWWCLSNQYLSNFDQERWMVVRYEELITNYKETVERIFTTWKLAVPNTIMNVKSKASSSTSKTNFNMEDQLNSWKQLLTNKEVNSYESILSYFNINYKDLYKN